MAEETIDPNDFRKVLGRLPTGVTVVTATDDDGPVGVAIGSFFSVSLDPPLVGFCLGKTSNSWARIEKAGSLCVNILSELQADICGTFAGKSDDKFAGLEYTTSSTGSPVLAGCCGMIDCTIEHVLDGGDHNIIIGRVRNLEEGDECGPLVFYKGGYGQFSELA